MKVKVAFVVNNYPPRTGGVELHVQALAHELLRVGHTPIVITLGSEPGWGARDGVEMLTLSEHFRIAGILGFPSIGTRRRLTKLLLDQQVDVVSVHTRFFPMSYVGYRAAKYAGLPLIHTEHGSDHVMSNSVLIRYASRMVDFTVGRTILRNADAVLGVSEEVCQFVARLAGVQGELFYNAIFLGPEDGGSIAPHPDRLVFVGRLVPGKGWEDFLDVVQTQVALDPSVTADVLGDGPDRDALEIRIRRLGLTGTVTVHGRVSQEEVRKVLSGATLVNPTVLSEGFQTTLLETIAAGGRVVTYPVPGALRLRDDGAPVRISSERTAAALTAELEAMRLDLPQAANRELIETWGWPRRARQYVGIIDRVLTGARDN